MFAVYSNKLQKFYSGKSAAQPVEDGMGKVAYLAAGHNRWTSDPAQVVTFSSQDMARQFVELIAEDLADWGMDADLSVCPVI